jgi:hypothetical protein
MDFQVPFAARVGVFRNGATDYDHGTFNIKA